MPTETRILVDLTCVTFIAAIVSYSVFTKRLYTGLIDGINKV